MTHLPAACVPYPSNCGAWEVQDLQHCAVSEFLIIVFVNGMAYSTNVESL